MIAKRRVGRIDVGSTEGSSVIPNPFTSSIFTTPNRPNGSAFAAVMIPNNARQCERVRDRGHLLKNSNKPTTFDWLRAYAAKHVFFDAEGKGVEPSTDKSAPDFESGC